MPRRTLILLVLFAVVVLGLYLTGAGLGSREPSALSCDNSSSLLRARTIALQELDDRDHCIDSQRTLRVAIGRPCTLVVGSTWSPRRRALLIDVATASLSAVVTPLNEPERVVAADLKAGPNELPMDRSGSRILVSCPLATCVGVIRGPGDGPP